MSTNKKIHIILQAIIAILILFVIFDTKELTTNQTTYSKVDNNDRKFFNYSKEYENKISNQMKTIESSIKSFKFKESCNSYKKNIRISLHKFVSTELRYNPYLPINILEKKIKNVFDVNNFDYTVEIKDKIPSECEHIKPNESEIIDCEKYTISKNIHDKYIIIEYNFYIKSLGCNDQYVKQLNLINFKLMPHNIENINNQNDHIIQKNIQIVKQYVFAPYLRNILIILVILITIYRLIKIDPVTKNLNHISNQLSKSEKIDLNELGSDVVTREISKNINSIFEKLEHVMFEHNNLNVSYRHFIADSFHQLNTPLTSIVMNSELIELVSDSNNVDEYIQNIKASVEILKIYSKELSYIGSEKTSYLPTYENISEIIIQKKPIFELMSNSVKKKIAINIQSNVNVFVNKTEFEILLENNFINILKSSKQNSQIEISLMTNQNQIFLLFSADKYSDSEINYEIFSEYYRESSSSRGNGAGLNLAKQICIKNSIYFEIVADNSKNIFKYTLNLT